MTAASLEGRVEAPSGQDQPRGTGRLATWFAGRVRRGDTCQESAQRNSLSPAFDLGFILVEIYSEKD